LEKGPVDLLSFSGCSEDIRFPVLDDETDEREGPKAFVGVEVPCMEGEEDEEIDIHADPRVPQMDGAFFFAFLSWWSWNKVW
jgi:hypothetical protein